MRIKIYSLLTILITSIEISLTSIFGTYGLSILQTCFLIDGSKGYWVAIATIFINAPIIIVFLLIIIRTKGYAKNKALQKTVWACYSMLFTWGIPTMTAAVHTIFGVKVLAIEYVSFVAGCTSGIILAATRLGSKEMIKRLWKVRKSEKVSKNAPIKGINDILIEESSVSFFFKDYTDNTIKDLLLLLSLALVVLKECEENYCFGYKKKKFYTTQEKYLKLTEYFDLSSFKLQNNGIWEYEREIFVSIRESCNISSQDLISSICSMSNFQKLDNYNTGGRSGAFIFNTFDEKLIIKTITRSEKFFLLDILPAYSKRVVKHKDSKLVRILGLFKILNSKQSFVVMENIIRIKESEAIFDLKGSTDNRYVESVAGSNTVLKDNNLIEMGVKVLVDHNQKNEFLNILDGDIKFFKKFNIIDYSLLIAFYKNKEKIESRYYLEGLDGNGYSLGIIDFLQEYTISKKFEVLFKRMKGQMNTSACSPGKYSRRFVEFLECKLLS